jgi:hypothetical protein
MLIYLVVASTYITINNLTICLVYTLVCSVTRRTRLHFDEIFAVEYKD